ncbi:unnamed protein product [Rotaria magnacalcarata]|uniref:L-type lectin-like domain-containing protein n=5 Tax=Rotaria magnacalcarata TaxID=392030 RepID=A0A814HGG9_9BILA|nr:unnamed protein product [Rotaria magnacalcarata]CAF1577478.1 unnamed protein product [Rotaria magnacalcarata]CAF1921880.1 unnamed protein product [Rotaria magnacalcarata]CAF1933295.1 unnamed protein product [Rotaria magnacalcarata]CAF2057580.1 unnamed protein product [Rotaria magnacalcarata]
MYSIALISFCFIFLINYTFQQGQGSFEVREHSVTRPYASVFSTSNSNWDLTGNTIVTDKFIRLTPDVQSKAGGLWNRIPVYYPDWEMHVQFKVFGEAKTLFGDGFVIWYVRDPKIAGPVYGSKDFFQGLAIVMDTYANRNDDYSRTFPYISAIVNNGSLHYNHDDDGFNLTVASCESHFRGRDTDTLVAIRYQDNRLTVSTDTEGQNKWTECFSIADINLPTHYYFGFSAATGELSDNHDIISVHTYQLESSEERRKEDRTGILPSAPTANMGSDNNITSKPKGWSVLKIFAIVALLIITILVGVGILFYMKQRRYHSSRLY